MKVLRRLAWFSLAALIWSCGGESTRPSSPHDNGCNGSGACPDTGGAGGTSASSSGGATGGSGGQLCTGAALVPDPAHIWANWSMPHPPSSGLSPAARYDTSQPDVVIDSVTGLMWSREASPIDEEFSFEGAVDYCAESEAGGFCDWRLPTRIELVSLVDFTRTRPAIDPVFADFPPADEQRMGWSFITSSTTATTEWRIFFDDGGSVAVQRANVLQGARARCVRVHTENEQPESRYLIEGQAPDDVVTDRGTGLTWQRRPSERTLSFSEAQSYCSNLALEGDGWRLPSMKELQTIVDESRPSPAVDPEIFPGVTTTSLFRTSTVSAECSDCAWLARPDGSVFDTGVNTGLQAEHHVRCVRPAAP